MFIFYVSRSANAGTQDVAICKGRVGSRGATDHKTHGSDRITDLSHGSDHFSDQQKKKGGANKTLLAMYSVKHLQQGTFAHGLK